MKLSERAEILWIRSWAQCSGELVDAVLNIESLDHIGSYDDCCSEASDKDLKLCGGNQNVILRSRRKGLYQSIVKLAER
jgi:hypothetical protein